MVYKRFLDDQNEKKVKEYDRLKRSARISIRKGESAETFRVNESPNKPAWLSEAAYNGELTDAYNREKGHLK